MSRSLTFLKYCFFCLPIVAGCAKTNLNHEITITEDAAITKVESYNPNNTTTENINNNQYQVTDQQLQNNLANINYVKYNPVEVVGDTLQYPSKNLKIAIVAPITGKYASIGTMIAESAMLSINQSKFHNSSNIKIYNIGNLSEGDWKENTEVKKLLNDDYDIIIGIPFEATVKKLLSVIPQDKLVISFTNNTSLSSQYPNLITISMDEKYQINSLLQYLQQYQRKFLAILLPATKKGYQTEKLFRKLAPMYQIIITNSQFYQPKSKISILSGVKNIYKAFTATYILDENGNFITETYQQNKKKQQSLSKIENKSTSITKTQTVRTNAIYIDADETDLLTSLNAFEKIGVLNTNLQIFSNSIINIESTTATPMEQVYYIGYNYSYVDLFNKKFQTYFKHAPNYIGYITYDVLLMLNYTANVGNMTPDTLYNENGFRGVLDEFRITRNGTIERRFSIYSIQDQNISRIFVPNDYISNILLNETNSVYTK